MPETVVVSLRLPPAEARRLKQIARRAGRTPSEVGAVFLGEGLRRADFAFIDFRDTADGRTPFVQGTRLAVWQVISLLRTYEGDVTKTASHLGWPEAKVRAAMAYQQAFPEEIENAMQEAGEVRFENLSRLLPGILRFETKPAAKQRT